MRLDRVKLSAEMTRRDMTAKLMSSKSGVSRATISGIKNGKSCSTTTANAIARALGVPIEQIVEEGDG